MWRYSMLAGVLAVILDMGGCRNNVGPDVLGPSDLPQTGELLTISSPKTLLIEAGEEGYLGGMILVEDAGVLSLVVAGTLFTGEYAGIQTRGGWAELTLNGVLDGYGLMLNNSTGGSINLDAMHGVIDLDNLSMYSRPESSLTWTSTGMHIGNLDIQNYGAVTRITDTGEMQVKNIYLKDQIDEPESGGITLNCKDVAPGANLTGVANGSASSLEILLQGQASWQTIILDINYGGSMLMEVGTEAVVSVESFEVDCSGDSQGRSSSGELINEGNFTADKFVAPDECDYEDITGSQGPSTWLVTFPGGYTFMIVNTGDLDLPIPL